MCPGAGNTRLRADRPDVIEETFDGEVTLVHLRTGIFYGMNATGSALWRQIEQGRTPETVARVLAEAYGVSRGTVEADIAPLIAELVDDQVLVPAEAEADVPPSQAGGLWCAPAAERYSDMADLLKLDPIHDLRADYAGWPVPREGTDEAVEA
ncbi:MAG: PqqD family protein [Solirubrobacteraceae bacterium]